ncbi:MAG TPA: hypothetical protein VFI64_04660, partial [Nitrososphaeraceae archaeon]|nr:hypothetical protein [Nitrososphaeraceae archaeon]
MKHLITIDLNGSTYVTPDSIRTLETKCGHVFSFQEKIFLANLGTTQKLLEILVNSQTYVRVTKQFPAPGTRRSCRPGSGGPCSARSPGPV